MVARHCGYRTVEINASDERTAATLHARIRDAVQMQSVMGAGRPNCVIIDEIDGATGASSASPVMQGARAAHASMMGVVVSACEHCRDGSATHAVCLQGFRQ